MAGYNLDQALEKMNDACIYQGDLLEAATEMFDECYLHTLPNNLKYYIDYKKFARDCELGGDMCEFEYAGTTLHKLKRNIKAIPALSCKNLGQTPPHIKFRYLMWGSVTILDDAIE